jgi:hypothetical protein
VSAAAAMVDWEVSAGEIKEPLAAANDHGNRFPSGLIQIQEIFAFFYAGYLFDSLPARQKFMVNSIAHFIFLSPMK